VFPDQRLIVAYTANLPLDTADATFDGITTDYILGAIPGSRKAGSLCCPHSLDPLAGPGHTSQSFGIDPGTAGAELRGSASDSVQANLQGQGEAIAERV
jgi:hypothetical protein